MKKLLLWLLRGYKKRISPHLGNHCRFSPTCSQYAIEAIGLHGAGKGILLSAWRVLRCNPFGKAGYDPVPAKGKWQNPARRLRKE